MILLHILSINVMIQSVLNSIQTHFPGTMPLPNKKQNGIQHSIFHFAIPGLKIVEVIEDSEHEEFSITTYKLPSQGVLNDFIQQQSKTGLAASIFDCPFTTVHFGMRGGDLFAPVAINNIDVSAVYELVDGAGVANMIE